MDKKTIKKECIGIVNQIFDLAEVPVKKRQEINDKADKYLQKQVLRLCGVVKSFYCNRCKLPFTKEEVEVNEHCNNCGEEMQ